MSQKTVPETLRIDRLEDPPYCVLIITQPGVQRLADLLKKHGAASPVIVAKLNNKYYPVGNLDSLQAYRKCGIKDVMCAIESVSSKKEMLEMHVRAVTTLTYHPLALADAVSELIDAGIKKESLSREMQSLYGINISKDARKVLDKFITNMSKSQMEVPSMMHILKPITRINKSKQQEVMSKLMTYSYTYNAEAFVPPDEYTISKILEPYATYDDDDDDDDDGSGGNGLDADSVEPIGYAEDGSDGDSGDHMQQDDATTLDVRPKNREIPTQIGGLDNTMVCKCTCSKEWLVDLKNATYKELIEKESHIETGTTHDGQTVYVMDRKDVSYLGLTSQPNINKRYIGGSDEGHTLIISKRNITKKTLIAISRLLDGDGNNNSSSSGSSNGNGNNKNNNSSSNNKGSNSRSKNKKAEKGRTRNSPKGKKRRTA